MRVLWNGLPLLGQRTGVGQYGAKLLGALARTEQANSSTRVFAFDGQRVLPAAEFLGAVEGQDGSGQNAPKSGDFKSFVRRRFPTALRIAHPLRARWANEARNRRLVRQASRSSESWTIFHEPNYVGPEVRLPLVTTIHDLGYLRMPRFVSKPVLAKLRRSMGRVVRQSRAILVDSEFTRRELLESFPGVSPDRVFTSPLGVDFDFYARPEHVRNADETLAHLGVPRKFTLYLGTLEPRKNPQGLLAGFAALPLELQREFPLVLAGSGGWKQGYFRERLNELKRGGTAIELGFVPAAVAPQLLSAASVFCFPSLYEGFGLPPLEAAACGTPVLCSNAASLPEVMGQAAYYVDPNSPREIAAGLRRLLENASLRRALSAAGRQRAREFTWDRCAATTLDAYRAAA